MRTTFGPMAIPFMSRDDINHVKVIDTCRVDALISQCYTSLAVTE